MDEREFSSLGLGAQGVLSAEMKETKWIRCTMSFMNKRQLDLR